MNIKILRTINLKPDEITLVPDYYPRHTPDWLTVYRYMEAINAGTQLPNLLVVRRKDGAHVLLDGNHTRLAHRRIAVDKPITCDLADVPEAKWLEVSIRRNQHGRPLDTRDKVRCFDLLKRAGYTLAQIEEITCVPVASIKRLVAERIVRKVGGVQPVLAIKGIAVVAVDRMEPEAIETAQAIFAASSQVAVLEQAVALFETDLLDESDPAVVDMALKLKDAVGAWHAPRRKRVAQ